jgi:hypothetical protein
MSAAVTVVLLTVFLLMLLSCANSDMDSASTDLRHGKKCLSEYYQS